MPDRPRIGITTCSMMEDYVESVRRAGGEPVPVDWSSDSLDEVLRGLDGLLMTGGPDMDPKYYGEAVEQPAPLADPKRDAFEIELARRAMQSDMAVLAICRGMQVLNVAAGGTLLQDIPSAIPEAVPHQVSTPKNAVAHTVRLHPGSRVAEILGAAEARVNSRHHQAVKRPGESLLVTATAPDGIVEAVEKPGARFCVGVEWHPENFVDGGEFLPLFQALVRAARRS